MTDLRDRLGRALQQRDAATTVGLALTAAWLVLVVLFWWLAPSEGASGLARLGAIFGVIMPLGLVWLAVGMARTLADLRAEADDLRSRLAAMRGEAPRPAAMARPPAPAQAPLAAPPRPAPDAAARAPAPPAPPRPADQRQTAMQFDQPPSQAVAPDDLIAALNFPDGPDDRAGIAALRAALRNHDHARVIRAAQDVVTLLARADIYMDDLAPAPAGGDAWRAFAAGLRGDAVAPLAAIRDAAIVDAAHSLLKSDEIFRDAAHHFLRHFDLCLTRIAPDLDDDQIAALGQTRSARAFMLLGQVAGMFG